MAWACSDLERASVAVAIVGALGLYWLLRGRYREGIDWCREALAADAEKADDAERLRATAGCDHGRSRSCPAVHQADDERLGEPICLDCYDYRKAILWNALSTELWRRTTIALHRALASCLGIALGNLPLIARVAFIKVIEYQRRGVVPAAVSSSRPPTVANGNR